MHVALQQRPYLAEMVQCMYRIWFSCILSLEQGFFFGIEALKGALNFPLVPLQGGLHLKRNKVSIAAVHVNEQEFRRVSN